MAPRDRRESLVGALEDPLRADVDPRPRGHLPVHRQTRGLELAELLPRRPFRHEERVRDEHARRPLVRTEHADRFSGLHQQRLVVPEPAKRREDAVERLPRARGAAGPAVDDELVRLLRHLRIEVVLDHPERGLLRPRAARERGAAGSADGAGRDRHRLDCPPRPCRSRKPCTAAFQAGAASRGAA